MLGISGGFPARSSTRPPSGSRRALASFPLSSFASPPAGQDHWAHAFHEAFEFRPFVEEEHHLDLPVAKIKSPVVNTGVKLGLPQLV